MSKLAKFQLVLSVLLISVLAFGGGFYFGQRGYEVEIRRNPPDIKVSNKYPGDTEVDFALFWEVWEIVNARYLERPVDQQELLYGAIKGMVDALGDPYTSYLPPELNDAFNNEIGGIYEGIGAELAIRDGILTVVAPLEGSPAEAAGVQVGDKILEVDGESTLNFSLRESVSKIRGDAGTIVNLTVSRDSSAPFVITIKRGSITTKSVSWEDKGNGNIYVRISRFGPNTAKDWTNVVNEISATAPEIDAVIVDLRSNGGGLITAAHYIASEFNTNKDTYFIEDSLGNQVGAETDRIGSFEDVPAVYVLINEGSASASEILAAALKSNNNATLVGKKSFGKGSIQEVYDLNDGSSIHITTKKWLTPLKEWVHDVGIEPDVEVDLTAEALQEGRDEQLEKALELADEI